MAKAEKDPGEALELSAPVGETITFVDQEYDRRKLFLPSWAELVVVQGIVEVRRDDEVAVAYMRNRPDFKEREA
jgi:hypothetical protein